MPEQTQPYIPNVYGLVDGPVNAYLLDAGESGLVVIDAGLPGSIRRMLQLIRDIGRTPQDVRHILITHADVDHVGSLKPLVDATGAKVYASQQTASYIQSCQSPPHISFPMIVVVNILNRLFRRAVPVNQIVKDNELLDIAGGIRVLETPGHTPDHISFYWERERVLFAGDLLDNEEQLEVSRRSTWRREESYRSTHRVLALNPAVIFPGHGHIWREDRDSDQLAQLKDSLPAA